TQRWRLCAAAQQNRDPAVLPAGQEPRRSCRPAEAQRCRVPLRRAAAARHAQAQAAFHLLSLSRRRTGRDGRTLNVTGESKRLKGKVAVVSGATSGIGRATCVRLLAEGASVVFCGRRTEQGAAIERELGSAAKFVRADVVVEDDVASVIETARSTF